MKEELNRYKHFCDALIAENEELKYDNYRLKEELRKKDYLKRAVNKFKRIIRKLIGRK